MNAKTPAGVTGLTHRPLLGSATGFAGTAALMAAAQSAFLAGPAGPIAR